MIGEDEMVTKKRQQPLKCHVRATFFSVIHAWSQLPQLAFLGFIICTLVCAVSTVCIVSIYKRDVMYPYTTERRDVLGNTSPEAREIFQGRGFCTPSRGQRYIGKNLSNADKSTIDIEKIKF